jgi:DNA-binding transcriptional LysR family regulator
LRIVVDSIIPFEAMLPLVDAFDREGSGTRLRFSSEALSGVWEALVTGRADLAIGATHDGPEMIHMSGDYQTRPLGRIDWVFAVSPSHPLASAPEPLPASMIQLHRVVAVGDTGRMLPNVTAGLLTGQKTLTVPSLDAKLTAQLAGLGCGHLPRRLAAPHLASGALVEKRIMDPRPAGAAHIAWRTASRGKCLKWFLSRLSEPATQRMLLEHGRDGY